MYTVVGLCGEKQMRVRHWSPPNTIASKWLRNSTVFHVFRGRLGNQLFQYAAIVGISKHHGAVPCFDHNPLSEFLQHQEDMCVRTAPTSVTHLDERDNYATHMPFAIEGDTAISGFLQSFRYFSAGDVLRDVQIKQKFKSEARLVLARVLNLTLDSPRVAIHIRKLHGSDEMLPVRMPHTVFSEDDAYLRFPAPAFFELAMAFVRRQHPDAIFVVMSDEPEWCAQQSYLQQPDVHIVRLDNAPILDLALIAECDHVILTRGTFGWWGAFLGAGARGGLVVYNAGEFDMQHPINKNHVVVADFYPVHWVAIPVGIQLRSDTQWTSLP